MLVSKAAPGIDSVIHKIDCVNCGGELHGLCSETKR